MKLKGSITILIDEEETTIEIMDELSRITFVEVKLTPQQLSAALSRLCNIDCEIDVMGLDRVGKKHEHDKLEFEITDSLRSSRNEKLLQHIAQSKLSDGWIAESYFGSKDSFFTKDGKPYARVTIRRWVESKAKDE